MLYSNWKFFFFLFVLHKPSRFLENKLRYLIFMIFPKACIKSLETLKTWKTRTHPEERKKEITRHKNRTKRSHVADITDTPHQITPFHISIKFRLCGVDQPRHVYFPPRVLFLGTLARDLDVSIESNLLIFFRCYSIGLKSWTNILMPLGNFAAR